MKYWTCKCNVPFECGKDLSCQFCQDTEPAPAETPTIDSAAVAVIADTPAQVTDTNTTPADEAERTY